LRDRLPTNRVSDQDWLVELTKQLYQTRSVATGGVLKEYLHELESKDESLQDLIHATKTSDSELINNSVSLYFNWIEHRRRYITSVEK
jgi:hypothetical protein